MMMAMAMVMGGRGSVSTVGVSVGVRERVD